MKIEHIAIWCKDIEALRIFYEKHFNAVSNQKYINKQKGFCSYFLDFDSGARIELMNMDSVPATANDPYTQFTGLIHLAISVGSDDKVDQMRITDPFDRADCLCFQKIFKFVEPGG